MVSAIQNASNQLLEVKSECKASKAYESAKKVFFFMVGAACDLALLPAAGLLALYAACKPNFGPIHDVKKDKTPILFIHGNGYNEIQWIAGQMLLSKDEEIGSMFSIRLDGLVSNAPENGIEEYAKKVEERVREIKILTGRSDVILVGHSMGGLIASYFTEHLAKAQDTKVDKVITISTPWSGSVVLSKLTKLTNRLLPNLFKTPKRFQNMRGEDGFLDDLKALARANKDTTYFSLYSTGDGFVSGESGNLGLDPQHTRAYRWMGHYTPMFSRSAWQQVQIWLKAPKISN